jgi:hypothetical protein
MATNNMYLIHNYTASEETFYVVIPSFYKFRLIHERAKSDFFFCRNQQYINGSNYTTQKIKIVTFLNFDIFYILRDLNQTWGVY